MPALKDYLALITQGIGDPYSERYARLRAWWQGNDQRRTSAREIPMSPHEADNVSMATRTDPLSATKIDPSTDLQRRMRLLPLVSAGAWGPYLWLCRARVCSVISGGQKNRSGTPQEPVPTEV